MAALELARAREEAAGGRGVSRGQIPEAFWTQGPGTC